MTRSHGHRLALCALTVLCTLIFVAAVSKAFSPALIVGLVISLTAMFTGGYIASTAVSDEK